MDTQEIKRIVEALIFAADAPLSRERILETLELRNGFDLDVVIAELNREYQESGRAFMIRQVAGGYQIATQPNYATWIRKLYLGRHKTRLSQAALETLSIIAFKQPISRVEIAQIRGVNSDGVIGTLLERRLITISGRSEGIGRPLLYGTTPEFLKYFGLNDLSDLPKPREIEELFGKEGMPEELLQALSQTDTQLSLPIHGDGEVPPTAEESENKAKNTTPERASEPTDQPASPERSLEFSKIESSTPVPGPQPEASLSKSDEVTVISLPVANEPQPDHSLALYPFVGEDHLANTSEIVLLDKAVGLPATSREEPTAALTLPTNFESTVEVLLATLESMQEKDDGADNDEGAPAPDHPAPELNLDPAGEIDGWLAEEFSQDDIAEPDFLLKTGDLILDDLRTMPPPEEGNGKLPTLPDHESAPAPRLSPSPILDEIFTDDEATAAKPAEGSSLDNAPMAAPASEEQSGDPPVSAETNNAETIDVESWFELVADTSGNEAQKEELLAQPEASTPEIETSGFAHVYDTAPQMTHDDSPNWRQAEDASLAPPEASQVLETDKQWSTLPQKTVGWIKRALHKLMALIGVRSDSGD